MCRRLLLVLVISIWLNWKANDILFWSQFWPWVSVNVCVLKSELASYHQRNQLAKHISFGGIKEDKLQHFFQHLLSLCFAPVGHSTLKQFHVSKKKPSMCYFYMCSFILNPKIYSSKQIAMEMQSTAFLYVFSKWKWTHTEINMTTRLICKCIEESINQ